MGTGHTTEDLETARRLLRPCLSLDAVGEKMDVFDEADDPFVVIEQRRDNAALVADCLDHLVGVKGLGVRSIEVLQMRFGLTGQAPMTLDQIGSHFGVTRERIRQIEKKALDELRDLI